MAAVLSSGYMYGMLGLLRNRFEVNGSPAVEATTVNAAYQAVVPIFFAI